MLSHSTAINPYMPHVKKPSHIAPTDGTNKLPLYTCHPAFNCFEPPPTPPTPTKNPFVRKSILPFPLRPLPPPPQMVWSLANCFSQYTTIFAHSSWTICLSVYFTKKKGGLEIKWCYHIPKLFMSLYSCNTCAQSIKVIKHYQHCKIPGSTESTSIIINIPLSAWIKFVRDF